MPLAYAQMLEKVTICQQQPVRRRGNEFGAFTGDTHVLSSAIVLVALALQQPALLKTIQPDGDPGGRDPHRFRKLFVFSVPGFVGYFASLGLPAVLAYAVIALELLGGFALILGVYAPIVALPLALEMLGTIALVHGANGWLFTTKGGGWEFPAFCAVGLVALFLLGDGVFALKTARKARA